MKITLIQPAMGREHDAYVESWKMEPLSMAALAGATPPGHEVAFLDDRCEAIPYDQATDLVAISVETYTARRAYQIAAEYRRRGVRVVLGGYHATLMPEETSRYGDALVVGEAEDLWPGIVADAERGQLRRLYRPTARPRLDGRRFDRSIFAGKRYMPLTLVESGRGCKFGCDFCSVTAFFKRTYGARPPAEVAAEIAATGRQLVFLVDDNVVADFDRAKALCREIAPLGITWISQGTLNIAKDPALLKELQKSGCAALLIGFESLSPNNLRDMNKSFNQFGRGYREALERIRDAGIKLYATFVFGYDHDTPQLFEDTLAFAMEQKFFVAAFNHLQPFPGTPLYRRLEAEGRMLHERWWLERSVRFGNVIFRPRTMASEELFERLMGLRRRFFSWRGILDRAMELKANLSSPSAAGIFFLVNYLLRKELDEKWGLPLGDLSAPDPEPAFPPVSLE
jgi:radical SAM superfamily enzyme YgiQ (UPF0313 family)